MSLFTQKEIKKRLHDATMSKGKISMYANLLGFRQLAKSKSRRGRQSYEGKAGAFYEEIRSISLELSKKYGSLPELQKEINQQENFTESLIEDVIMKYGPDVWNEGNPDFVTMIDGEGGPDQEYPRHLIYNNESDRIRIRTFAYCLTLKSMCQDIKKTGPQSQDGAILQPKLTRTAPRGSKTGVSKTTAPDPETVPVEPTRIVPLTSASSDTSESRSLEDVFGYQVPVAHMVPTVNTEDVSSSSTMSQPNRGEASFRARNNFTTAENDFQSSEKPHSSSIHMALSSLGHPSNNNSIQREETGGYLPLGKRKRNVQETAVDKNFQSSQLPEFAGRIVRPRRGLIYDISPSASPDITLEFTENSADQRPMDIHSNGATIHDTNVDSDDGTIAVTHLHIGTVDTHGNTLDGTVREDDSVVGSSMPSPTAHEQNEDNEPTLVVKLKIQSKEAIRKRKLYRMELAVKLLSFFDMCSEQPKVLGEVVTLIKEIKTLEFPLLQRSPGSRYAPYHRILDDWLALVDIYLRYRENRNCDDDLRIQATHRDSVETTERFSQMRYLMHAQIEATKWSYKHENYNTYEWSKCVTSTLLEIADWRLDLTMEDREFIRKRFVQFNDSVIRGLF